MSHQSTKRTENKRHYRSAERQLHLTSNSFGGSLLWITSNRINPH